MKIEIQRTNDAVRFEGRNEEGNQVTLEGGAKAGGEGKGVRPMELVAMSLGGCASIDLVLILEKMKQDLQDLKIQVEGKRAEDQVPAVFTHLHIHFILTGTLDPDKVARAVSLSVEKYCSVGTMLAATAEITHSFEIVAMKDAVDAK